MEVPILIDGKTAGSLRVSQSGLYTVMEAELDGHRGELVRLWVHGGGRSAYLGVMQPWSAGLWLRRKLSRAELRAFPDPIEFASDREQEGEESDAEGLHNAENAAEQQDPETPPETRETPRESDHSACPWPAEPPEEGLVWYRRPDGSLTSFDGVSSLLALPAKLRGAGPRGAVREIEGKKYLVFRY